MGLRLFVGLPLPEEYQKGLERVRDKWSARLASRMTWTRPGNWHVTLKFLGDVHPNSVSDVTYALSKVSFAPYRFCAGGAGFFPNARRPRVAWVGLIKGGDQTARLAGAVEAALSHLFEPESRTYNPHLTLARVKVAKKDPWEEFVEDLKEIVWPEIEMARFVLYSSVLGRTGPKYTELASFEGGR